tara:strand:+ start:3205 stop:4131 length:927 start_codon:yes stop_codon:yes gene_type:complete
VKSEIKKNLFVSIDADDWYFARWATGAKNSYWSSIDHCLLECYNSSTPPAKFETCINQILSLFDDLKFKSTFFFTGFMANFYPNLVKKISNNGHEIACHNLNHIDYAFVREDRFKKNLLASKNLLEDLTGKEIIGYRSPNSSIPSYLSKVLVECNFLYDSSITPTRKIMGKFGNFTNAPTKPYFTSIEDISVEGNQSLLEFPWPTFPILKLPAGSGIMHRIAGSLYNQIAIQNSLRNGYASYYFHPYEIASLPKINIKKTFKVKIFERKIGKVYYNSCKNFLYQNKDLLINGRDLYNIINQRKLNEKN